MSLLQMCWFSWKFFTSNKCVGRQGVVCSIVAEKLARVVQDVAVRIVRIESVGRWFIREHKLTPHICQCLLNKSKFKFIKKNILLFIFCTVGKYKVANNQTMQIETLDEEWKSFDGEGELFIFSPVKVNYLLTAKSQMLSL